jgi:hypothetical protein
MAAEIDTAAFAAAAEEVLQEDGDAGMEAVAAASASYDDMSADAFTLETTGTVALLEAPTAASVADVPQPVAAVAVVGVVDIPVAAVPPAPAVGAGAPMAVGPDVSVVTPRDATTPAPMDTDGAKDEGATSTATAGEKEENDIDLIGARVAKRFKVGDGGGTAIFFGKVDEKVVDKIDCDWHVTYDVSFL